MSPGDSTAAITGRMGYLLVILLAVCPRLVCAVIVLTAATTPIGSVVGIQLVGMFVQVRLLLVVSIHVCLTSFRAKITQSAPATSAAS